MIIWSNTDETINTSRWASVVRMPASNMFDTRPPKLTKHRPSNTRTKEMFYAFDRMLDGLQILSNTTKHDQTRSNRMHQTKCPNGKMFGHQRMFDGVWSPNIYRLSRPLPRSVQYKFGEQGWRGGESAHLPLMCPGYESRTWRHMWVEFVVGSLLCSERLFN